MFNGTGCVERGNFIVARYIMEGPYFGSASKLVEKFTNIKLRLKIRARTNNFQSRRSGGKTRSSSGERAARISNVSYLQPFPTKKTPKAWNKWQSTVSSCENYSLRLHVIHRSIRHYAAADIRRKFGASTVTRSRSGEREPGISNLSCLLVGQTIFLPLYVFVSQSSRSCFWRFYTQHYTVL